MSHYSKKNNKGFNLVELLVTIGIMFVILTVVLSNQSTYTDGAALSGLADELSLTISQAQAYGIAVRELTPGSSDFSAAYGLSVNLLGLGNEKAYLFFADRNGNQRYDGSWNCQTGPALECLERVDLSNGNYIDDFCIVRTNGADQCGSVRGADISFLRPEIEARIKLLNSSGQEYNPPNLKGLRIVLRSPLGKSRSVIIYPTGQVSVE